VNLGYYGSLGLNLFVKCVLVTHNDLYELNKLISLIVMLDRSTPESRLWGAFLLQILKDSVPVYVTFMGRSFINRMSVREYSYIRRCNLVRYSCYVYGLDYGEFMSKLGDYYGMEPTLEFMRMHNLEHKGGDGRSVLLKVTSDYLCE